VKPTVEVNGNEIVIRLRLDAGAANTTTDRLIRVEHATLDAEGFELSGIKSHIRSGALPYVKIGRSTFVRMSDLLALPKASPSEPASATKLRKAEPPPEFVEAFQASVAKARGRR
jgi:hypothetical protein